MCASGETGLAIHFKLLIQSINTVCMCVNKLYCREYQCVSVLKMYFYECIKLCILSTIKPSVYFSLISFVRKCVPCLFQSLSFPFHLTNVSCVLKRLITMSYVPKLSRWGSQHTPTEEPKQVNVIVCVYSSHRKCQRLSFPSSSGCLSLFPPFIFFSHPEVLNLAETQMSC